MDIEQLTKSQIVLLTLLVSFVTSIATGIVTVSLMDQAPPAITQTVNRVVERTVERVVPSETQPATVITNEETVIVKESELIVQAIDRAESSVVRLYHVEEGERTFVGLGVMISNTYVATDSAILSPDAQYSGTLASGNTVSLTVFGTGDTGVVFLMPEESSEAPAFKSATLNTDRIELGQSVVAFSGTDLPKITNGIAVAVHEANASSTPPTPASFETNMPSSTLQPGSVAINTDGAVVGIFIHDMNAFVSARAIRELFEVQGASGEAEGSSDEEGAEGGGTN